MEKKLYAILMTFSICYLMYHLIRAGWIPGWVLIFACIWLSLSALAAFFWAIVYKDNDRG